MEPALVEGRRLGTMSVPKAREGGGEQRRKRQHDAGKLTARERIDLPERIGERIYGGVWDVGWQFHPLSLLFIASGSMMISTTLRIPKP